MTVEAFQVTGMTCGHCVQAVTAELTELPGVTDVFVELVPGQTSTVAVHSDAPLSRHDVAAAVDEAGYRLAGGDTEGRRNLPLA